MAELTPSGRQLEILKVLWDLGEGSVREVREKLCPDEELAFNTVQTLMRIMEKKGLVTHRAEGRTFIYSPCYSRERVSSRFLHKVFDGAIDQLVLSMLKAEKTGDDELEHLERLISEARSKKQSRKKRGK